MRRISIAVLFLLIAAVFSPAYAGWVKSTNAPDIPTGQGLNGVEALCFINPDTGWAVGWQKTFYKTTDGARSWERLPNPSISSSQLFGVYFLNSKEGWIVGGGQYFPGSGLIGHTTDGGITWEDQVNPDPDNTLFDITNVGDEIWAVGWTDESATTSTHGILLRTSDYGATWQATRFPTVGGLFSIYVYSPNSVWLVGENTVIQTTDNGQNWYDRSEGVRDANITFQGMVFVSPQVGYLVGNGMSTWGGKFFVTTNSGQTWNLRKVWGKEMQALGLAVSGQTIYVAGGVRTMEDDNASIIASQDGGQTWKEAAREIGTNTTLHTGIFQFNDSTMVAAWRTFWYFDPNAPEQLFVSVLDAWKATIAGRESYQPVLITGVSSSLTFRLLEAPKWAKVDTLTGVITGVPANSDIGSSKIIVQVTLSDGRTDTMTILLEVVPPVTAVEEEEVAGIPSCSDLSQNYPNPFNPETMIDYSLSEESDVRLSVYDLLGQELIILVSEKQLPGFYSVKFTAANLPSGSYILRLTAGGAVQTRKMTIIR